MEKNFRGDASSGAQAEGRWERHVQDRAVAARSRKEVQWEEADLQEVIKIINLISCLRIIIIILFISILL